jgi:FKBP-type peptidyl-prolyl cis-trans isomerase (trigger factor)
VPVFRKGRAPLKRVKEHYLKDVRARAIQLPASSNQLPEREEPG